MIQATLILVLASGGAKLLRRYSSAQRYVLWAAALGAAALIPLAGFLLEVWKPGWARTVAEILPAIVRVATPRVSAPATDIVVHAEGIEDSGKT